MSNKVVVILGPTSSGKTKWAVKLANQFNGEIVSADSRQVYKGMDVGTGKDLHEYKKVKYHLIDVVKPNQTFNLAKYQKLAFRAIDDILKRSKVPIIAGGTGLYIRNTDRIDYAARLGYTHFAEEAAFSGSASRSEGRAPT